MCSRPITRRRSGLQDVLTKKIKISSGDLVTVIASSCQFPPIIISSSSRKRYVDKYVSS